MNGIKEDDLADFLKVFIKKNKLKVKEVAKEIDCSTETLERIIAQKTFPTSDMIKQVAIMISMGFKIYKKTSKKEKEKISLEVGLDVLEFGLLDFKRVTSVIKVVGSVAGLSVAGVSSGLTAVGAVVGGGVVAGIATAAIVPIAVGGVGYAIFKGAKVLISNKKIKTEDIDNEWEYLKS